MTQSRNRVVATPQPVVEPARSAVERPNIGLVQRLYGAFEGA
jgi:hypothetical protein